MDAYRVWIIAIFGLVVTACGGGGGGTAPPPSDTTPPDTIITSAPVDPTDSTTATFGFTSTEAGSIFECSLDGSAFAACASLDDFTGLAEGAHSFSVQATDSAGNTDATPAIHNWLIDLTPPDTSISSAPALLTNSTRASFTFTSTETGSTFQCSLDGAAFTDCTNPQDYTALAEGNHTFSVQATDAAGNNDAMPAVHNSKPWFR